MSETMQEAIDSACDEWMTKLKAFHESSNHSMTSAEITVSEESFDAGYKAASPTPLQAAALAALVAWREAHERWRTSRLVDMSDRAALTAAEKVLLAAADRLIASESATTRDERPSGAPETARTAQITTQPRKTHSSTVEGA